MLLNKLSGGDRRSIGQANKVAALVLRRHTLFPKLMQGPLEFRPADPNARS
jgi:hypothetical protein